jgi:hypothetical protein
MNITATIAWSLIWSAAAGMPFAGCGMMSAASPWSGHYSGGDGAGPASSTPSLNGPLFTTAHTTQFAAPGWRYLSVAGGGSGFLPPSAGNGSFVSFVPGSTLSDVTIIIEKVIGPCKCSPPGAGETADGAVDVVLTGGLPGEGTVLHVWRTNATRQFWQDQDITVGSGGAFSVFVARDEIVTVSTVSTAAHGGSLASIPPPASFPLPYADDFSSYAEDTTPVRFFSDQTGSFAARAGALTQVVPIDPGPNRWTNEDNTPLTLIGDASLGDVVVTVGATFMPASKNESGVPVFLGFTYVQACARVTSYTGLRNGPPPGYCLSVNSTGAWAVLAYTTVIGTGQLAGTFVPSAPHTLVLSTAGTVVAAWVADGSPTGAPPLSPPLLNVTSRSYAAGAVALGSGFHFAAFDNFTIAAA